MKCLRTMIVTVIANLIQPFSFRGKGRLLQSLCPKEGEQDTKVFGYTITADLSDYIQRSMYLKVYEPYETSLVKRYLKPGMVVVDVGANVGYYALLAASLVGEKGKVLAFEPSPYAFGKLSDTIHRNHLTQIHAIQAGLSGNSGEACLYLPKRRGNHTPSMIPNDGGAPHRVSIYKLDDCLKAEGIEQVDLMKIDVEGFEPNVIAGAGEYLRRGKIRAILCEFHTSWLERNGSSSSELYDTLVGLGFRAQGGNPDFSLGLQNIMLTHSNK